MLMKNFKRKVVIVSSLMGHVARFEPGQEREVPECLVDECIAKGLMPADDFKQAVLDAQEQEASEQEKMDLEKAAADAAADEIRAKAIAEAAEEAELEAAEEAKKRSDAAKKAAATRKANQAK